MAKLMNRKQAVGCSLLVAPHDCAACRICVSQRAELKRS